MTTQVQLPDKLSDLAELALADLRKCEADDGYRVDISAWHAPEDGVCLVCLAGAVMAQTLGHSPFDSIYPDGQNKRHYFALNALTAGHVNRAILWMKPDSAWLHTDTFRGLDCKVPDYDLDRPGFYAAIEGIIRMLREHGL